MDNSVVNNELEYSIIGAICIDSRIMPKISCKVSVEDFSVKMCKNIFAAALEATSNGSQFDAVTALNALSPNIDRQEARNFIRSCMDITPTVADAEYHAELLHSNVAMRRLRNSLLAELTGSVFSDGAEMASAIIGKCQDYLQSKQTHDVKSLCQALVDMYAEQNKHSAIRVDTGFQRLDSLLKGVWSGNLCVIAARPAVGKSALALQIAENAAKNSGTVLIYSMEMTSDELAERLVSRRSGIPMNALIDGNLSEEQQKVLALSSKQLSTLPIFINDSPNITVSKIRSEALSIRDLKLIIVDYLSLMKSSQHHENRNLELGAISRELKNLAAELKLPVIALAQLNRGTSETEVPTLRNLRDSGEIEQNANKVIFIWLLDKENGEIGLSVAKNRRGATGNVKMRFDGVHMTFTEVDYLRESELVPKQSVSPPWNRS